MVGEQLMGDTVRLVHEVAVEWETSCCRERVEVSKELEARAGPVVWTGVACPKCGTSYTLELTIEGNRDDATGLPLIRNPLKTERAGVDK